MVTGLATLEAFLKRRVRTHGLLTASIAAAVHRGELAVDDADRETDARTDRPAASRGCPRVRTCTRAASKKPSPPAW
ncbi:hypothetical protein [Mycobacterium tuberculosis]|uniref:hypothetical protein n=1 Tax=Mycobacterium tuberculosis TaxID=1773 RepID=UPI0004B96A0B